MRLRGMILSIIYANQDFKKLTIKDDKSSDTFILSVKNDVFFGSVGDSCDFDIDCVVIEKKKNEEVISNQHMFVRKMALVEE